MHPDDQSPYKSREDLFATIKWQRIEIDNLHERIRKLESKQVDYGFNGISHSELDDYAAGLPP